MVRNVSLFISLGVFALISCANPAPLAALTEIPQTAGSPTATRITETEPSQTPTELPTSPPPEPTPAFVLQDPAPLHVRVQLDESRAVAAWMLPAGGTLTAQTADGSTVTLSIPTDALLSGVLITMTPLSGMEGLPASSEMIAGVHLEPEGLLLMEPATLTIVSSRPMPIAEEITLSVQGPNDELMLYPVLPDQPKATFLIFHFSDYLVGQGTAGEQQAIAGQNPTSPIDQLQQQIGQIFADERKKVLAGQPGNPEMWQQIQTLIASYLQTTLMPQLQAALTSTDIPAIQALLHEVFSLERFNQLLPIDLEYPSGYWELVQKVWDHLTNLIVNDAYDRCMNHLDLSAVQDILGVMRQRALLGYADEQDDSDLDQKVDECLRLKLEFRSKTTENPIAQRETTIEVKAIVILSLDWSTGVFSGAAPIEYLNILASPDLGIGTDGPTIYCQGIIINPIIDEFRVLRLVMDYNLYNTEKREPPKIEAAIDIGNPTENIENDCSNLTGYGLSAREPHLSTPWYLNFFQLYSNETLPYIFKDWVFVGAEGFAIIESSKSSSSEGFFNLDGEMTLILKH